MMKCEGEGCGERDVGKCSNQDILINSNNVNMKQFFRGSPVESCTVRYPGFNLHNVLSLLQVDNFLPRMCKQVTGGPQ